MAGFFPKRKRPAFFPDEAQAAPSGVVALKGPVQPGGPGEDGPPLGWLDEDAVGLQSERAALREFVEKDVPRALEECLGRCLSKHGLSQETRLHELQGLLREEHAPLNASLAQLSEQVAGADGAKLDQLAAKVDRLADMIEGQQSQLKRSIGELLDEKVIPIMMRVKQAREAQEGGAGSHDGTPRGAARTAGRAGVQEFNTRDRNTQTTNAPSDVEGEPSDGEGEPITRTKSLSSSGAPRPAVRAQRSALSRDVLESLRDEADRHQRASVQAAVPPWRDLRRRFREHVRSIREERLRTLRASESRLESIVQSFSFELLFSMIIIAHLIYMVVQTDQSFGKKGAAKGLVFEVAFMSCYIIELVLRIAVDGWHFFFGINWKVNLFDTFLAITGTIDVIVLFFFKSGLFNSMALKVLRVFRLQKVLRIHRVMGMASDTRMVLQSLVACGGVLVGASILVFIYFLVFGIFFTQAISGYVVESGGELGEEALDFYVQSFSTVFRTVFTLYQTVSGGLPWPVVWDALYPVWPGGLLGVVLVAFHFVFMVLVANVVSSVYVQKVLLFSRDQTQGVNLHMERKDRHDAQLILRDCARTIGDGDALNYRELLRVLVMPDIIELFDARGIRLEDVRALHEALAVKPDGPTGWSPRPWELTVDRKKFFMMCMRLTRAISTADFAKAHHAERKFETRLGAHYEHVETTLDKLTKLLEKVPQRIIDRLETRM